MTQRRFDVPPSDPFFWGDDRDDEPFGPEVEEQRRQEAAQAGQGASWIQRQQEKRRREKEQENTP